MTAASRGVLLVLGIVLGLCGTVPRAAGKADGESAIVLSVRLTTSSELSAVSQRALINEAESIWRDARVQLRWIRTTAGRTRTVRSASSLRAAL